MVTLPTTLGPPKSDISSFPSKPTVVPPCGPNAVLTLIALVLLPQILMLPFVKSVDAELGVTVIFGLYNQTSPGFNPLLSRPPLRCNAISFSIAPLDASELLPLNACVCGPTISAPP